MLRVLIRVEYGCDVCSFTTVEDRAKDKMGILPGGWNREKKPKPNVYGSYFFLTCPKCLETPRL